MFGEFALYSNDKWAGLICAGPLFIEPTRAGGAWLGEVAWGTSYPGAKPAYLIDGASRGDGDWLAELVRRTLIALPSPQPRAGPGEPGSRGLGGAGR